MSYTWTKKNATTVEMVASTAAGPDITVSWTTTNGWTVTAGGQTSSTSPIIIPGPGAYDLTVVSSSANQNVNSGPTPTSGMSSSVIFGGQASSLTIQLEGSPMGV